MDKKGPNFDQHSRDTSQEGRPGVHGGPPSPRGGGGRRTRRAARRAREGLAPKLAPGTPAEQGPTPDSRAFHGGEVTTRLRNRTVCPLKTGATGLRASRPSAEPFLAPERTTAMQRTLSMAVTCPLSPRRPPQAPRVTSVGPALREDALSPRKSQ